MESIDLSVFNLNNSIGSLYVDARDNYMVGLWASEAVIPAVNRPTQIQIEEIK